MRVVGAATRSRSSPLDRMGAVPAARPSPSRRNVAGAIPAIRGSVSDTTPSAGRVAISPTYSTGCWKVETRPSIAVPFTRSRPSSMRRGRPPALPGQR